MFVGALLSSHAHAFAFMCMCRYRLFGARTLEGFRGYFIVLFYIVASGGEGRLLPHD